MADKKLPQLLKPETVWDVCEQAAQSIELLPTHYYQGAFATPTDNLASCENLSALSAAQKRETCGTSFCRAGWMVATLDADKQRTPDEWDMLDAMISYRARKLLLKAGAAHCDINQLFDGDAVGGCGKIGTKAYAAAGAKGLRDFMKKYEAGLKATKVEEGD